MLRARGSRCAGWGRGVGGRPASSSETCCSSSVRSKDGVIERPCSQEVPELTVSISGNRRRENLSPALGGVHRECGGFPLLRSQPCYHISTWARAPGEASWGGRCCLEGWSVLGLRPGEPSSAGSSSSLWAWSPSASEGPCGLPGSAHRGPFGLKVAAVAPPASSRLLGARPPVASWMYLQVLLSLCT